MRSHKLISGSFLNTVNLIAQIAAGLYVMPLLIHAFGDAVFGIWILVGAFMGYASVLDLGLPSAVNRFISQAIGRGGDTARKEITAITSTSFYIFIWIMIAVTSLIGLVILFAPVFLKDDDHVGLFRQLLIILCLNNFVVYPSSIFEGVLAANLRHDLINSRKIVFTVLRLLLTIVIVKYNGSLIAIAWMTAITNILENLIRVQQSYQIDPHISVSLRNFQPALVKKLWEYSVYTLIGKLADMMRFQINTLIISCFMGVAHITPYRIAARLIEYFTQLIGGATGVFSAYFSQEEGKNNFNVIKEKFLFINRIISYCATFVGGVLILFGKDFIERWVGPEYAISYQVLVILAIPMTLALLQSAVFPLLYGVSKHQLVAYTNIVEGILNLILSLILVKHFGILGVAMGMAIPMIITKCFVQPIYVTRLLNISLYEYLASVLVPFVKCAVVMGVTWFFMAPYVRPDYLVISLSVAVQSAIFVAMLYLFGFSKVEKQYILAIIKKK